MQRNRDRLQLSITGCFSEGIGRVGMVSLQPSWTHLSCSSNPRRPYLSTLFSPLIPVHSSRSLVSGGLLLVSNLKTRQTQEGKNQFRLRRRIISIASSSICVQCTWPCDRVKGVGRISEELYDGRSAGLVLATTSPSGMETNESFEYFSIGKHVTHIYITCLVKAGTKRRHH